MAPSFDCSSASLLLCAEDNNSLMCIDESDYAAIHEDDDDDDDDDHDGDGYYEFAGAVWHHHQEKNQNQSFFGDFLFTGIPIQDDESLGLMIEKESDHLPRDDYLKRLQCGELDMKIRREAVDWIGKVHAHYSFGPLCAYLAISYLDRFLSVYELPRGKAWMIQLLAVACLSLAAKMEETEVPLALDLQVGETKYVFEAKTIQRMEIHVLSTLNWRMQAVTPFSYIDYFLYKMNNDQSPPNSSISRCVELVLNIIKGIGYLEFRPSEVSAAVAISVLGEIQTVDIDKAEFHLVDKERVFKCVELIQGVSLYGGGGVKCANSVTVPSVPHSPMGVLDAAACLSYKSDEITVGSCANSFHSSPEGGNKRRKLNHPSDEFKS